MTNFENLKDYVKGQLRRIVDLERAMAVEIDNARYTTIGGNRLLVGPEIYAAKKEEIRATYTAKIEAIHSEIQATLDKAQKEANQEYYNVKPHPTADERAEMEGLIRAYNNSADPNKERAFIQERDFHLENETRLARIYVFAGIELQITSAEASIPDDRFLAAIHSTTYGIADSVQVEHEELLYRIAPAMKTAQGHVDMVVDARRFYGIFNQLSLQAKLVDATPDNFRHFGYYSWEETMANRASIKRKLFEMGADPNMALVTFINSELQ